MRLVAFVVRAIIHSQSPKILELHLTEKHPQKNPPKKSNQNRTAFLQQENKPRFSKKPNSQLSSPKKCRPILKSDLGGEDRRAKFTTQKQIKPHATNALRKRTDRFLKVSERERKQLAGV